MVCFPGGTGVSVLQLVVSVEVEVVVVCTVTSVCTLVVSTGGIEETVYGLLGSNVSEVVIKVDVAGIETNVDSDVSSVDGMRVRLAIELLFP